MRRRRDTRDSRRARPSRARALLAPEALVVLVLALALAAVAASTRLSSADVELTAGAAGSLTLSNTKEGAAILSLGNMRPGDSTTGTVTIGNTGTVAGDLSLSLSNLLDAPGAGGGALSGELDLVVTDVTNAGAPVPVYTGKIAALPPSVLGTLAPSESRTYEFRVLFPDAGPGAENAYQGSSMSVQFDWTAVDSTDTTPPQTTITAAPDSLVASGSATLSFDSNEAGSTFECSLDGAAFASCTSPMSLSGLADGAHTFDVRATDPAGNTDSSPAGHAWTVDTTPPSATMTDPGAYVRGTVTLASSTSDSGSGVSSVTYQRSPAGAGSWSAVSASWNTAAGADGLYDLRVVAVDNAGNSTTSAVVPTRVDNTKPALASSSPADGTTIPSAGSLVLTADESVAGVANATIDGAAAPAPSVSGTTVTFAGPFADGPHTLAGELADLAGNRRPVRVHFTVWSLAAADYPYVEKNSYASGSMSLRSASDTTTVTVPGGAWTGAPAGDWLVVRVDPAPAAAASGGFSPASEILDVRAYWALTGGAVHDFASPLAIEVDTANAEAAPATLAGGKWRSIRRILSGQTLPGGWADGYYRTGATVVVLTRHLSFFTLLEDVQAPGKPRSFKGAKAGKKLHLSWKAATDNSGTISAYRVYANGKRVRTLGSSARSVGLGAFRTTDTRAFQVAAVDGAGNVGAKTAPLKVVPNVAKRTLAAARKALIGRGFKLGKIGYRRSTKVPAGAVISASASGLRPMGAAIGLTVSSGSGEAPRQTTETPPPAPPAAPPSTLASPGPGSPYTDGGSGSPSTFGPGESPTVLPAVDLPAAQDAAAPSSAREHIAPELRAGEQDGGLRKPAGLALLGLAFAAAVATGLRGVRRPRRFDSGEKALDDDALVLWDARLLRFTTNLAKRAVGRA